MRAGAAPIVFILLAGAMAGCTGGGDAQQIDTPTIAAAATDDSGAISGLVVNEEGLPVAGAQVALVDAGREAMTDDAGAFAFNNLTAGEHKLIVQKLGYESIARTIDVALGEVTDVEIGLKTVEVSVDPFVMVLPFDGYIHCGVNPYWPTNVCGDTLGEDNARFPFDVDLNWSLEQLVVELDWTPATAVTAQHLELDICNEVPVEEDQLLCYEGDYWDWATGPPPLVMVPEDPPLDEYTRYMVTVGAGFPDEEDPMSLFPALQQHFSVYISQCYVEECGDAFTAMPPE